MFNQGRPGKLFPNMSCSSETLATGGAFNCKPLSSRFQQESVNASLNPVAPTGNGSLRWSCGEGAETTGTWFEKQYQNLKLAYTAREGAP